MKTIREIANELGVDKQKVYRFIKQNHINEAHHEALQRSGVKYYDEAAEIGWRLEWLIISFLI